MNKEFDICVIGAGLIGSAAAKYCAASGAKTCLIGPPEPSKETFETEQIYGAWFDEGRITRVLSADKVWSSLALESIKRYRQIEQESGVSFFTENGYLLLVDGGEMSDYARRNAEAAKAVNLNFEMLDEAALKREFGYLNIPGGMVGLYERTRAGTINPRRLVEAQLKIFQANAAGVWMKDVAVQVIQRQGDAKKDVSYTIRTKSGQLIVAKKIVACIGAFYDHYPILPPESASKLDWRYRKTLVSRIRVHQPESIWKDYTTMPSIGFVSNKSWQEAILGLREKEASGKDLLGGTGFYVMMPLLYPDGHCKLKIGFNDGGMVPRYLEDARSVNDWYRSAGSNENVDIGKQQCELIQKFVKGLDVGQFETNTCVNLETVGGRPYVGEIGTNYYLVIGGNGHAAKSSDQLGRIGAELALSADGIWPECAAEVTQEDVRPRFKAQ